MEISEVNYPPHGRAVQVRSGACREKFVDVVKQGRFPVDVEECIARAGRPFQWSALSASAV